MKHKDEQIHKLKYHTTLLRQANQNDYYKNPVMAVLAQATVQYTFSVTHFLSSAAGRKYGTPHFHGILSLGLLSELCFGQKD